MSSTLKLKKKISSFANKSKVLIFISKIFCNYYDKSQKNKVSNKFICFKTDTTLHRKKSFCHPNVDSDCKRIIQYSEVTNIKLVGINFKILNSYPSLISTLLKLFINYKYSSNEILPFILHIMSNLLTFFWIFQHSMTKIENIKTLIYTFKTTEIQSK